VWSAVLEIKTPRLVRVRCDEEPSILQPALSLAGSTRVSITWLGEASIL
jgi:hypothetical protein